MNLEELGVLVETHVSRVVLTDDRAYKMKKAVTLPFVDQGTLARRKRLCEEEVRLNAELAPGVYRGVVPLVRNPEGTLRFGGEGEIVEWAVEMERLPDDGMFDRLPRAELQAALPELAEKLRRFYAHAPRAEEEGSPASVRRRVRTVLDVAEQHLDPAYAAVLRPHLERRLDALGDLFARRAREGFVVEGHGDLHTANLCRTARGVVAYDRLEFDRFLRCGDIAFDLAFLVMSLETSGQADLVPDLLASFEDPDLDRLVAFYKLQRALVRANVSVFRGLDPAPFDRYAVQQALPTWGVLLCGLPATGKSTRARALGGTVVRSDAVRKRLCGIDPDEHWQGGFDEGPYDPNVTAQVYEAVAAQAAATPRVVVDAQLGTRAQRAQLIAALGDRPWVFVHLHEPDEVIRARLAQRATEGDISDADWEVYGIARDRFEPPDEIDPARVVPADPDAITRRLARQSVDRRA